ncbi:hypothetical protein Rsub_01498 [Raphidocelis subcapitata]|uniref:Uncharacterized protein n=1 Tax=Raphidocelis subcapitata TaxID=307507 RepID=A0A2V0NP10_9CHLO|nr:hypothetical protein Rsub_01498 [Raphidocelis subcapitata]|eukprot:GBF88999.1 hypothetical protein Rsub_01498 [Raphidocelis subcapitata]
MTPALQDGGPDQSVDLGAELRRSVLGALVAKAKGGSSAAYTTLVRDLVVLKRRLEADSADCEAEFSLAQLLRALTGCVSSLRERKHEALLAEVLSIRVWLMPKDVRAALLDALVNLMVANGAFTHNCLQALLFSLLPPPGAAAAADEPGAEWAPAAAALEVQGEVLCAIEKSLQLIPTLPTTLLPMLLQNLPHKTRDRVTQCLYLRASLALAERPVGAPLREGLLLGVVDHLLSLDVEIKWEDIVDVKTGQEQEEGSSEEEEDPEDIFELEGMQELDIHGQPINPHAAAGARPPGLRGGWEGGAGAADAGGAGGGGGGAEGAEASGRPPVDEAVDKLDSMMELVLQHMARRCEAGQLPQLWATLLAAFERSLLHTHRSKFTQYLLFRACAEDPARCCGAFVSALLSRLRDARQAPITRAAAAAYLASFLARCALVPEAVVVDVLSQLAAACTDYAARAGGGGSGGGSGGGGGGVVKLSSAGSGAGDAAAGSGAGGAQAAGGDAQRHAVFYAMVQALLYVLCYHMEPLVHQQRQHPGASPAHAAAVKALVRGAVVPLLGHPRLAPLAVCLPSVSAEFVRQAAALGLADLAPLLAAAGAAAQPQPQPQPQAGGEQAGAAAAAAAAPLVRPAVRPLEMFFPFDPYLLRRSARYLSLDSTYVRWRGGHPEAAPADGGGAGAGEGAAGAAGGGDDDALLGGSESSSGSGSDSEDEGVTSSSDFGDDEDHHMAASLDGPGSMTPPGLGLGAGGAGAGAAAAAAAAGLAAMHRAASIGRLRPVGVAAAAAARQQQRLAAVAGLSVSGPSPDALMLGASLVSSGGLPESYGGGGAGGAAAMGGSPGGVTPLGTSPAPMSFTPYGEYMQSIPARLNGQA